MSILASKKGEILEDKLIGNGEMIGKLNQVKLEIIKLGFVLEPP